MQIYFAHPIILYHSIAENKGLEIMSRYFDNANIINPSEADLKHRDMTPYYEAVDYSDVIVYMDIAGFVTAGVGNEILRAFERGKDVYKMIGEQVN